MTTGAHRAHQHIDGAELLHQFHCQPAIGLHIVGVAVLVGVPGLGVGGQQLADALSAGFLPSPLWVGLGDEFNVGAEGGEHVLNDGFHTGIGHQSDGVTVHCAG